MKLRFLSVVVLVSGFGALGVTSASCATGGVVDFPDSDTPGDAGSDAPCTAMCSGQCSDLKTDNANCGKCGAACPMGASCIQGSCQCMATQSKCGTACVDLKKDNTNCGKCGNVCGNDAGAILGGGTWTCANGTCAIQCPMGKTECSGACVDANTDNDNCGSCGTTCNTPTEQCMSGLCCKMGEKVCNGADGGAPACTDTMSDALNCGGCNMPCPMNKPNCSAGMCVTGVTWSESFTSGQASPSQCNTWNTFRAALTGSYTSITIKGSNDMVGATCTGAQANTLCQALHNNQSVNVGSCNGRTWATGNCGPGLELTATGTICSCNSGYTARPCIANLNWGGVNGVTCSAANQTITVICQ